MQHKFNYLILTDVIKLKFFPETFYWFSSKQLEIKIENSLKQSVISNWSNTLFNKCWIRNKRFWSCFEVETSVYKLKFYSGDLGHHYLNQIMVISFILDYLYKNRVKQVGLCFVFIFRIYKKIILNDLNRKQH